MISNKDLKIIIFYCVCLTILIFTISITNCERATTEAPCVNCLIETTWVYPDHTVTSAKEIPLCEDKEFIEHFEKINTYADTVNNKYQICHCK